jgi:hypothetical protein
MVKAGGNFYCHSDIKEAVLPDAAIVFLEALMLDDSNHIHNKWSIAAHLNRKAINTADSGVSKFADCIRLR